MKSPKKFNSLLEVMKYFSSEKKCLEYLEKWRWRGKIECPHCEHDKTYRFSDKKRFKCASCKKQFTAKVGSIFDSSKISLSKWFCAMYLNAAHKKGISSYQLASDIEVTQKTAWFMLHRIRKTLEQKTIIPLEGVIMVDETFVGGKNKNRHLDKKVPKSQGRVFIDKTPVVGFMEAGGSLKTFVIPDTQTQTIRPILKHVVKKGSIIVTDEWNAYKNMDDIYHHEVVDHTKRQYVSAGGFTTNPIEGFWSHLKRKIIGIHHFVSRKHLQRYVDDITFKFNTRKMQYSEKLALIISNCNRVLRYKTLVYGKT